MILVDPWDADFSCTFAMPSRRLRCPPACQAHSLLSRKCAWQAGGQGSNGNVEKRYTQSSRRSTPWRELTSYFLLRPRGASLLAQTGRSEQGDVRSQSRWPRLDPPPPPFHRTHGLRRRPAAWPRQAEGRTIEVESSSLAPRASPRDRVTTPAGREEPGTSLYPSYNDPPDAPRPRQCQGGDFGRLQQAGIAGSGRIWASQLALQPAWAGPGRGGQRGGRGKQR